MNTKYYGFIECGETIPLNNPHAFSASMPTVQDVIDYEEETDEIKKKIKTAYPRIVFHPYIRRISEMARIELGLERYYIFILPNDETAKRVSKLSETEPSYGNYKNFKIAYFNIEDSDNIKKYYNLMKHCGYMVYSREAEDFLIGQGEDIIFFEEEYFTGDPEQKIKSVLEEGYNSSEILLTNCGMNAIYAGYETAKSMEEKIGRDIVIQYGWAYSDTLQIFKKLTKNLKVIEDVSNTQSLEDFLKEKGENVGILYLETISNPLIEVPDFLEIFKLSQQYDFKILVDNTFATPWAVDLTEYCDLIFESLTKFASGHGDVMAGAVIRPTGSRLSKNILDEIKLLTLPLYNRVAKRLAYTIGQYKQRVEIIEKNTKEIADYLSGHPKVESLFTVQNPKFVRNWEKIAKVGFKYVGVISVVFKCELKEVYDNLDLPKGPSLGTEFPLLMSYTLLAHYFETKTKEGMLNLNRVGLSPKLLRLSVGVDDPKYVIDAIKKALK